MRKILLLLLAAAVLVPGWSVSAQEFEQLAGSAKADLDKALEELSGLQKQITEDRIPLSRQMNQLERQVLDKRTEYDKLTRSYENQLVDLNVLKSTVKKREDDHKFMESLLNEYVKGFEVLVHISEVSRYQEDINQAKAVMGNADLTPLEKLDQQAALLRRSLERIDHLIGGGSHKGRGLTPQGTVEEGTFALVGPVAVFASDRSPTAGVAELRRGSAEPTIIDVGQDFVAGIASLTGQGSGQLPVDATGGNALKISETKDTVIGHIKKGGPVMFPILLLGFSALLIALFKWWEISRIRVITPMELQAILSNLKKHKNEKAIVLAREFKGPVGEMLESAIKHAHEKKEYIEEVMYEKMLTTKPRLERFMPMVALSAATAPLLGLLGTVTGMINTFNMITVFGTGDPKTLAGGISEALITTEFGLIVAVPSLLLHAFISRKAKGVIGSMEQTTVGFINGIPSPEGDDLGPDPDSDTSFRTKSELSSKSDAEVTTVGEQKEEYA